MKEYERLWLCRDKGKGAYVLFAGREEPVRICGVWTSGIRERDCRRVGEWVVLRAVAGYGWHPYLRKGRGPIEVEMLKLVYVKTTTGKAK